MDSPLASSTCVAASTAQVLTTATAQVPTRIASLPFLEVGGPLTARNMTRVFEELRRVLVEMEACPYNFKWDAPLEQRTQQYLVARWLRQLALEWVAIKDAPILSVPNEVDRFRNVWRLHRRQVEQWSRVLADSTIAWVERFTAGPNPNNDVPILLRRLELLASPNVVPNPRLEGAIAQALRAEETIDNLTTELERLRQSIPDLQAMEMQEGVVEGAEVRDPAAWMATASGQIEKAAQDRDRAIADAMLPSDAFVRTMRGDIPTPQERRLVQKLQKDAEMRQTQIMQLQLDKRVLGKEVATLESRLNDLRNKTDVGKLDDTTRELKACQAQLTKLTNELATEKAKHADDVAEYEAVMTQRGIVATQTELRATKAQLNRVIDAAAKASADLQLCERKAEELSKSLPKDQGKEVEALQTALAAANRALDQRGSGGASSYPSAQMEEAMVEALVPSDSMVGALNRAMSAAQTTASLRAQLGDCQRQLRACRDDAAKSTSLTRELEEAMAEALMPSDALARTLRGADELRRQLETDVTKAKASAKKWKSWGKEWRDHASYLQADLVLPPDNLVLANLRLLHLQRDADDSSALAAAYREAAVKMYDAIKNGTAHKELVDELVARLAVAEHQGALRPLLMQLLSADVAARTFEGAVIDQNMVQDAQLYAAARVPS